MVLVCTLAVTAQSQAMNGLIEGSVRDLNGVPVSSATVTIVNVGTGTSRTVLCDQSGRFRFPLLPLGTFSVAVTADGFAVLRRNGISLVTGQAVILELRLSPGGLRENVTVTSDAPAADAGKIDQSRVMNSREVRNIPLHQNPYNFVFLQSNVTGNRISVPGLGFANVNANGFSRRGNYQIDGNYATDMTIGGVRMLFLSPAYIQEVQLLTNGMNAEFGATVGHVMNVITPSGTNSLRGEVGYQFRRSGFAARPFNVGPEGPAAQPLADIFTTRMGGPILDDRWHFYAAFEASRWDLATATRAISIAPENRGALIMAGVPESSIPATYDAPESYRFYIGRTDLQLNGSNRLGVRYFLTEGTSEKLGIGAAPGNTLQLTRDNVNLQTSLGIQLISSWGEGFFNELRLQRSQRDVDTRPNEITGNGDVNIRIDGIAAFGSPMAGRNSRAENVLSTFQNNTSFLRSDHALKAGLGFAIHHSLDETTPSAVYTFATLQAYLDAAHGIDKRSYRTYSDTFGNARVEITSVFWNAFLQDEWHATRSLKVNVGIRWDLFTLPDPAPSARHPAARKFKLDRNNFGPRIGLAWQLGAGPRPAVVRASAGIYYDPPILNYYQRAIQGGGDPAFFSFSFGPISAGTNQAGPEFPNRFAVFPATQSLPTPNIEAIDPDFKSMSSLHTNLQFEKALGEDISFTVAYKRSSGRHIPTSRQVNCLPTVGTLADGRLIYGQISVASGGVVRVLPCTRRLDPRFNLVWVWESVGNLEYNAATFTLAKRYSSGYQMSLNYTLARSWDDAAEENITATAQLQSDPSNRRVDRARSISDQTHTFVGVFVARPKLKVGSRVLRAILNDNQISIVARASDGERYDIRVNIDLNGDGALRDRPVGIPRNFLQTPAYLNVDLRYSRFFAFSERHKIELYADVVNLTNTNSVVGFNNTVVTANNITSSPVSPLTGILQGPLPDFRASIISNDSRRVQLGLRISF